MTATGSENAAAIGCSHTLAEAVLVDSLAVRWLECPFHICNFLYFSIREGKDIIF